MAPNAWQNVSLAAGLGMVIAAGIHAIRVWRMPGVGPLHEVTRRLFLVGDAVFFLLGASYVVHHFAPDTVDPSTIVAVLSLGLMVAAYWMTRSSLRPK